MNRLMLTGALPDHTKKSNTTWDQKSELVSMAATNSIVSYHIIMGQWHSLIVAFVW